MTNGITKMFLIRNSYDADSIRPKTCFLNTKNIIRKNVIECNKFITLLNNMRLLIKTLY